MLLIDRVLSINEHRMTCEMDISGHWVFPMHFPRDPIFPGSFLIEAAGQAVAVWGWHEGLRGRPRLTKVSAKFEGPVLPENSAVRLEASVRRRKWVCLGEVDVFISSRRVAKIKPMVIIIPA